MVTATTTARKAGTTTRATTSPANAGAAARSTLGTKMRTRPAKRGRTAISNSNGNNGSGSGRPANIGGSSRPAPRPCAATLELMAQQWEAAKAAAKLHYTEADRIEQEIIEAVGVGGLLPLSDGRTLRVKDNFRDAAGNPKIKAYSMAGVKLCEVEVK